jgi:hypothetical protein
MATYKMNPANLWKTDIDDEPASRNELTMGDINNTKHVVRNRLQEEFTGSKQKPLISNQPATHDVEICNIRVVHIEDFCWF